MAILRHKFKAKPCEADGIKFASKKEHKRYQQLKILQNSGEILFFLRQVPFHLEAGVKYVCDFLVFWTNGEVTVEDLYKVGAARAGHPVKVLGNGDISVKVNVTVHSFSSSASEKISAAGGSIKSL